MPAPFVFARVLPVDHSLSTRFGDVHGTVVGSAAGVVVVGVKVTFQHRYGFHDVALFCAAASHFRHFVGTPGVVRRIMAFWKTGTPAYRLQRSGPALYPASNAFVVFNGF